AVDDHPEVVVVGLEERNVPPPLLQPLSRRRTLHRLPTAVARLDRVAVDQGRELEAGAPFAPSRDDDLPAELVAADLRYRLGGDAHAPLHAPLAPPADQAVVDHLVG